ncbi:MAG: DUF4199 family protein [Bacteroidia bacterium]
MSKRVVFIAFLYSVLVIIYKLIIILGGYQLTRFGFYYSHILSVFFVIPFIMLAIQQVRDKDLGGTISGKNAFAAGLGVAAIAVILLSIYSYIEFEWKYRELAIEYYNSADFLEVIKRNKNVKPDAYPKIISDQIAGLSAIKAVTAKVFSFMFISASSAFICAVFMKRN